MKNVVLILLLAGTLGCGTVMIGGSENMPVNSLPAGARVTVTNEAGSIVFQGTTPTSVLLDKDNGYFSGETYRFAFSKPGYAPRTLELQTGVTNWYIFGNLLIGGLIGWLIVDPLSGGMWVFDWEEVSTTLDPLGSAAPAP